jgi:Abortive infection C-terminus
MPVIFSGSGASGYQILRDRYSEEQWRPLSDLLRQLLARRKQEGALKLLNRFNWRVVEATNDFADEFGVLQATVPLAAYVENGHLASNAAAREAARILSAALTEITPDEGYIRHVGFDLDTAVVPAMVATPEPQVTSRTVHQALVDADRLLDSGSAVSALDRVHTALLGYLRLLCEQQSLQVDEKDSAAGLLKRLNAGGSIAHAEHTLKVLRSAGAILDAFDPIRNRGSMAHANVALLDQAEAELVINVARSIFRYVTRRFE